MSNPLKYSVYLWAIRHFDFFLFLEFFNLSIQCNYLVIFIYDKIIFTCYRKRVEINSPPKQAFLWTPADSHRPVFADLHFHLWSKSNLLVSVLLFTRFSLWQKWKSQREKSAIRRCWLLWDTNAILPLRSRLVRAKIFRLQNRSLQITRRSFIVCLMATCDMIKLIARLLNM